MHMQAVMWYNYIFNVGFANYLGPIKHFKHLMDAIRLWSPSSLVVSALQFHDNPHGLQGF